MVTLSVHWAWIVVIIMLAALPWVQAGMRRCDDRLFSLVIVAFAGAIGTFLGICATTLTLGIVTLVGLALVMFEMLSLGNEHTSTAGFMLASAAPVAWITALVRFLIGENPTLTWATFFRL